MQPRIVYRWIDNKTGSGAIFTDQERREVEGTPGFTQGYWREYVEETDYMPMRGD